MFNKQSKVLFLCNSKGGVCCRKVRKAPGALVLLRIENWTLQIHSPEIVQQKPIIGRLHAKYM